MIKDKAAVKNKDKLAKALHVASRLRARGLKRPSIELKSVSESARESKNAKKKTVALVLEAGPPDVQGGSN